MERPLWSDLLLAGSPLPVVIGAFKRCNLSWILFELGCKQLDNVGHAQLVQISGWSSANEANSEQLPIYAVYALYPIYVVKKHMPFTWILDTCRHIIINTSSMEACIPYFVDPSLRADQGTTVDSFYCVFCRLDFGSISWYQYFCIPSVVQIPTIVSTDTSLVAHSWKVFVLLHLFCYICITFDCLRLVYTTFTQLPPHRALHWIIKYLERNAVKLEKREEKKSIGPRAHNLALLTFL